MAIAQQTDQLLIVYLLVVVPTYRMGGLIPR